MTHRAKKSLGQNFLKSELALNKIIEAGEVKREDVILEIGPGKGALTKKLLEYAGLVIAVEKDRALFEFLKIKFEKEIDMHTLILVCEDILKFEVSETISKFFLGPRFSGSLSRPDHSKNLRLFRYKLIANIPYNITGAILKKFLTAQIQPELMVLMVQHEVAKRILATDKKESILSISVKAYGEPKMIMKMGARYFSPAPKVDSAIISIKNISRKVFSAKGGSASGGEDMGVDEGKFWEIVKAGFAHKRKKLSSNLKTLEKNGSLAFTEGLGNKRAEDLTLLDWIALAK